MSLSLKSTVAMSCWVLACTAWAATARPGAAPAAAASAALPAAAASRPAPAVPPLTPVQSRAAQREAKARGSVMAACQTQAAEQHLPPLERKQFLVEFLHAPH